MPVASGLLLEDVGFVKLGMSVLGIHIYRSDRTWQKGNSCIEAGFFFLTY